MIMRKHGFTRVRIIEGLVSDVEQNVKLPHDGQESELNGPVKVYYIQPERKEDK